MKKVIIIGAGIGGLFSAILLKKAGYIVKLYERDKSPRTIGAGVVLWKNALEILEKHELLNVIFPDFFALESINILNPDGVVQQSIQLPRSGHFNSAPAYPILRKDLHQRLLNYAQYLGIEVNFNSSVTSLNSKNDKVIITIKNAGSAVKIHDADIIIGADGRMSSKAREYVNSDNTPNYLGYINWVGICNILKEVKIGNAVLDYWGKGERFGIVPYAQNSVYWAGCKMMPLQKIDETHNKRYLLEIFQSWAEPIQSIINSTDESSIKAIPVFDLSPINNWYKNNLVLLGDSAHAAAPTTGQGACQAFEDADYLLECLKYNREYQQAFQQYQTERLVKTTQLIHHGRKRVNEVFNMD